MGHFFFPLEILSSLSHLTAVRSLKVKITTVVAQKVPTESLPRLSDLEEHQSDQ